ncbi:1-acyl-sn-glycerol-3-phosphate acyltransferase [Orobanche minor]
MAITAVVIIPIGLLFLVSGLIVNLLQGYMPIKKLSKCWERFLMRLVQTRTLFVLLSWFVLSAGKERALLICNDISDIDWLVGWVLAQRAGCVGRALALIKKASIYLPVSYRLVHVVFRFYISRVNWAKDEDTMKGLGLLRKSGLPVRGNILIHHTKGFVAAVTHLRSFVPVIYNMTVAIPKNGPPPTLLRLFRGCSSTVHVHIERHLMQELPEMNIGIAQWCKDVFVAKEMMLFLERHLATNTFGNDIRRDIGRPKRSLLVVICWSCSGYRQIL